MTLVNRLIREARAGARILKIRPQDVGPIAEHIRATVWLRPGQDSAELATAEIRQWVWAGSVKMLGVPIEVIGA